MSVTLASDAAVVPARSVPAAATDAMWPLVDHAHHHGMMFPPLVRFPCEFPRAGA